MCESTEERRSAFEAARADIDPAIVDRVMRGLPVPSDHTKTTRNLRLVWARYHERM